MFGGLAVLLLLPATNEGFMRLLWGGGPGERSLYMKLPLDQVRFHWNFLDEEALLAGSLEIEIHGATGRDTIMTVFREGAYAPGWKSIGTARAQGQVVYFGFIGDMDVWTHEKDSVVIRFHAAADLEGIGPHEQGVLRGGHYEATASYSLLTGHPGIRVLPLRQRPQAFIGCWRTTWEWELTENEGWMGVREEPVAKAGLWRWLEETFPIDDAKRGTDGHRCVDQAPA
ncbi:hypothetical protein BH23GEM11_BH23GEM11_07060 [soil metagenome]